MTFGNILILQQSKNLNTEYTPPEGYAGWGIFSIKILFFW
jgi:hypothetical protein